MDAGWSSAPWFPVSGPGLEDNKSMSSVHAWVNPASVLIYPNLSPNSSSLVPDADTTASTPAACCIAGPHEFLHGFLADISVRCFTANSSDASPVEETGFKMANSYAQSCSTPISKQLRPSQRHRARNNQLSQQLRPFPCVCMPWSYSTAKKAEAAAWADVSEPLIHQSE